MTVHILQLVIYSDYAQVIPNFGLSDHLPVFFNGNINELKKIQVISITYRDFKNLDANDFLY
jgi:hypothetical protein